MTHFRTLQLKELHTVSKLCESMLNRIKTTGQTYPEEIEDLTRIQLLSKYMIKIINNAIDISSDNNSSCQDELNNVTSFKGVF